MFGLGPTELVIILIIVIIIFGPRRLPELGKTIGRGISELRKASEPKEDMEEENGAGEKEEKP